MAVFTDGVFSDTGGSGSGGAGLGTLTAPVVKSTAGVASASNPALDYISPLITAPVASATTITLPETGLLVPITGTTQIDFITVPTGSAPRLVALQFGSGLNVRQEVAGAPGGAANITVVQGGTVNSAYGHQANTILPLMFEGMNWRKFPSSPHWEGNNQLFGTDAAQRLILGGAGGIFLQLATTQRINIASAAMILLHNLIRFQGRVSYMQGSVASASSVTFPFFSSVLVTGTTTMNTFVATGWEEGMEVLLEFDGILIITSNSGGTNDFVSKDGAATINTTAGMALKFRFDGTDMREIGR